jgi:hypothetical protein
LVLQRPVRFPFFGYRGASPVGSAYGYHNTSGCAFDISGHDEIDEFVSFCLPVQELIELPNSPTMRSTPSAGLYLPDLRSSASVYWLNPKSKYSSDTRS